MTKWVRFEHAGAAQHGVLQGDAVQPVRGTPFDGDTAAVGGPLAVDGLKWLPPCQPRQIVALWNNFRAAAEKSGWAVPAEPLYLMKSPHCVAAHQQAIAAVAPEVGRVTYEGELAIVIGRRALRVSREDAAAHILGYSCANDVTAIEVLSRDASFAQWTRAKSFPGFGAFGPCIDTAFDPATATLRTLVGGRERQNYALSDMFFPPAELVHRLSQDMVLEPGDVILCGTSLGVLPMKPGTTVDVVIDGLGTLSNSYG